MGGKVVVVVKFRPLTDQPYYSAVDLRLDKSTDKAYLQVSHTRSRARAHAHTRTRARSWS
jgi:hypothetical protein